MFDTVWLRSFATVTECLSFTVAAERLGIRQSTVSEHVRKLESLCGRRLFVRDTHSVALTRDGEAMLGFAKSILATNDRALHHFSGKPLDGRVRLGICEDVALSELPAALRGLVHSHPRVELELTVGVSESLRAKLDEGGLDLAFVKRLPGDSHGELACTDPLVWAASTDFQFDPGRPVPLVVLEPPALTREIALRTLEHHARSWRIACSSDSQSGVHAAVLASLGIAPHARSLLPPGLVPLQDASLPSLGAIEFVILTGRHARGKLIEALSNLLRTVLAPDF